MVNKKIYDINYWRLVVERLPHPLRFGEMIAWVEWLCLPLIVIYNLLLTFRRTTLCHLSITPQVCRLRKMLNDKYDFLQRRITIEDAAKYDKTYLWLHNETRKQWLYSRDENHPLYLYLNGETSDNTFDFIVRLNGVTIANRNEMEAIIDNFKLAGKKYTIQ